MTTVNEAQDRAVRPQALILTVYGVYGREPGGLSVGSLIKLMSAVGVDEPAVRQALSRLKRRGVLEPRRGGGPAGYELSKQAREMFLEGDRRIFHRTRARLKDGWVLAVFSVPETQRDKRHAIRSRLTWLGYGTVAPGVWIAPARLEHETLDVLDRHGLSSYVHLFRADYRGVSSPWHLVGTWWDFEQLERLYDDFRTAHEPVLNRWKRRRSSDDAAAFADYVRTLTVWRRLPFLDPGLAPELLPLNWNGTRAAELFTAIRDLLAEPARRHVDAVVG